MKKPPRKNWSKYNTKSLKVPRGKEGSLIYDAWLKEYGPKRAKYLYQQFKYLTTHGQNN